MLLKLYEQVEHTKRYLCLKFESLPESFCVCVCVCVFKMSKKVPRLRIWTKMDGRFDIDQHRESQMYLQIKHSDTNHNMSLVVLLRGESQIILFKN